MKKIAGLLVLVLISSISFGQKQKKDLSLENIWRDGILYGKYLTGLRSRPKGETYTVIERDRNNTAIVEYQYKNGKEVDRLLSSDELSVPNMPMGFRIQKYQFSADDKKVLLGTASESIYRRSSKELYFVYDFKEETLTPISDEKVRYATFNPEGTKVAYVKKNNIYIKDLETGEETAVTKDGVMNEIINGSTDWVYEEEFAFTKAFFWSPSGNKIAFYRFDERNVPEYNMTVFGKGLYPNDYRYKYPKAGEENAKVTIHIYDVEGQQTVKMKETSYEYIPRIKWTASDEKLAVIKMNRYQSILGLLLVDSKTGESKNIMSEFSKTYIDIHDNLTFFCNNEKFLWTSEKNGFNHLFVYDINGKNERQITTGEWEITKFYGFDEKNGMLYYQSTESSPLKRDVYRISINGTEKVKLSPDGGTNNADFSSNFKYFVNYHSTINTPYHIAIYDNEGEQQWVAEDNARLREQMDIFNLSKAEFMTIPNGQGTDLNAWIIKPKDFDPNKEYPVIMHVYGGPGSQTVTDAWGGMNYFWHQMMAQKGYIVVSVDNRGTGARGADFKKVTYQQLGKYETEDQIAAAKYLAEQSYVDEKRISIWGWSYGGYMSSLALMKGNDVFAAAIAVAPVTNWKFYDSIYTERYMRTPKENPGYEENSPINYVDRLKGKYLMIHGTGDDNVHFQNAVAMTEALVQANKDFDVMYYPDKDHGIYGGYTRLHLYRKMTQFLDENLK